MNKFFFRKVLALIVAAVAVVAVYFYTDSTVKEEINPTKVVVATQDIPPHSEIKAEMVQLVEVPAKALPQENPYAQNIEDVVGKWTVEGYGISNRAYINTKKISPKELLPDSGLLELKEGEYAFSTQVDLETSHGNTIKPGTKVDLYLAAEIGVKNLEGTSLAEANVEQGEDGKTYYDNTVYYFGRVVADARVVEVKDNRGNKVFTPAQYTDPADGSENKAKQQVAKLYTVAVDLEELDLVNKASLVGNIIPVVSGTSYNELESVEESIGQDFPEEMADVEDTKKILDGMTIKLQ